MATTCCGPEAAPRNDARWRRALWIALAANIVMFFAEIYAGATADSRALLADALDFLGDSANYAISLLVAGMALVWRARAALAKGITLAALGLFVLALAVLAALGGSSPRAETMGIVGVLALLTNFGVALMLFRFRSGDANMRSVWICSRNDAIGNIAVVAAAAGVFGTGTAWLDLIVAAVLAGLGLWGGGQIILHAVRELKSNMAHADARPGIRMRFVVSPVLLSAGAMRFVFALLAACVLLLSVINGAAANAAAFPEPSPSEMLVHYEADGDEVPDCPFASGAHHHHSAFGEHQIAVPDAAPVMCPVSTGRASVAISREFLPPGHEPGSELDPPRA